MGAGELEGHPLLGGSPLRVPVSVPIVSCCSWGLGACSQTPGRLTEQSRVGTASAGDPSMELTGDPGSVPSEGARPSPHAGCCPTSLDLLGLQEATRLPPG